MIKILILGVSGMLGSTLARFLSIQDGLLVVGTSRSGRDLSFLNITGNLDLIYGFDAIDGSTLDVLVQKVHPNLIINCIGVIKQDSQMSDRPSVISINSLLPHLLTSMCEKLGIRLIQISTDCVFSGRKGNYSEDDFSDCDDLYGKSKYLGEVSHSPNVVTLRTSIIGHELFSNASLLEWFLGQSGVIQGYSKAIFSGITTLEMAKVIFNYVLSNSSLCGLYHLSADAIDKYTLLNNIAKVYDKNVTIINNDNFEIDRSLDSSKFRLATGWTPSSWDQMINEMHLDFLEFRNSFTTENNYVSK